MNNMKHYQKPNVKTTDMESEQLLAALSMNDEIGGGQLGKQAAFEADEEPAESTTENSVWE